jgi:hypothetical protein
MINAQFKLIPLVFDTKTARHKILSINKDIIEFPSISIESNADIITSLEFLVSKNLKGTNIYCNFKLTDVVVSETLDVYYIAFITYETLTKDDLLLDINTNYEFPANAKKIIQLL